jgi:hypothetical protein
MRKFKLWFYRLIPKLVRVFNPGYSYCKHCGLPWNIVNPKDVNFTENRGFFIVCTDCWEKCSIEKLKTYLFCRYVEYWKDGTFDLRLNALIKEKNKNE